jgi:4-aminobutyrate aminotransferase-like enzyme
MRTGHEHPHLKDALANYMSLLAEMGHDDSQQKKIVDTLIESVGNRISP